MIQIIEGTWEEIAAHAEEFNGHRLRVIDLGPIAESPVSDEEGPTLAELFAGRLGTISGPITDMASRTEEYFAEIMDEKYPREKA